MERESSSLSLRTGRSKRRDGGLRQSFQENGGRPFGKEGLCIQHEEQEQEDYVIGGLPDWRNGRRT